MLVRSVQTPGPDGGGSDVATMSDAVEESGIASELLVALDDATGSLDGTTGDKYGDSSPLPESDRSALAQVARVLSGVVSPLRWREFQGAMALLMDVWAVATKREAILEHVNRAAVAYASLRTVRMHDVIEWLRAATEEFQKGEHSTFKVVLRTKASRLTFRTRDTVPISRYVPVLVFQVHLISQGPPHSGSVFWEGLAMRLVAETVGMLSYHGVPVDVGSDTGSRLAIHDASATHKDIQALASDLSEFAAKQCTSSYYSGNTLFPHLIEIKF